MADKEIKFIDNEHERFWEEKNFLLQIYKNSYSYYKALVYTLGISEVTRSNFNKIFDIKKGEINIDSIKEPYQTSTSAKVTRMAFSLFNGCNYDSEQDIEKGKVSENYNVSDIFACSYAPYFIEAIKIRYPEYFRQYQKSKVILLENQEKDNSKLYGAYIRIGYCQNEVSAMLELEEKKEQILKFCKDNGYNVNHIYCDIGFSGSLEDRISLGKIVDEVNKGKLEGIIAEDLSTIIKDSFTNTKIFLENIKGQVISIQEGVIKNKNKIIKSKNTINEEQRKGRIESRMKLNKKRNLER